MPTAPHGPLLAQTTDLLELPLGESRFGPRLHAFVVSLNLESRLSIRQIQRLLKQSFNLSISVGAISDMIKWTAQHT